MVGTLRFAHPTLAVKEIANVNSEKINAVILEEQRDEAIQSVPARRFWIASLRSQ